MIILCRTFNNDGLYILLFQISYFRENYGKLSIPIASLKNIVMVGNFYL